MTAYFKLAAMPFWVFVLAFLFPAQIAVADESQLQTMQKSALFEKLANASTQQEALEIEDKIWRYWFSLAPTPEVQAAMEAGMKRREAYDFESAEQHYDEAIKLAPEFAEAHNQRAFIRFLRQNYAGSLTDLPKRVCFWC